jgi:hypothetical protein
MQTAQRNSDRTEHLLQALVSKRGINQSVGRFQSASIRRIHHMNKKVQASQKSYDEINFDQMPILAPLVKALIPFAKMDRPGALECPGRASEEELHDLLERRAKQRRHGPAQILPTNADFRTAAKMLFDLTGAVPEAYWSYGIKFE